MFGQRRERYVIIQLILWVCYRFYRCVSDNLFSFFVIYRNFRYIILYIVVIYIYVNIIYNGGEYQLYIYVYFKVFILDMEILFEYLWNIIVLYG